MRHYIILALTAVLFTSCVSTKKHNALSDEYVGLKNIHEKNLSDLARAQHELVSLKKQVQRDSLELARLRAQNDRLVSNMGEMATLSKKEAENLEKSLEKINEKDMHIKRLQDAIDRKDSVTFALVTSIKGAIGDLNDEDIQIQVDKGAVFVSISDKFLFKSGSYNLNSSAKTIISKVAKILESKPDFEVMVEGHTDNVSYRKGELLDNWDLSTKRATSIVRVLQEDFKIDPARMTAAGRSEYVPLTENETPEGRAANRRTRIIILPKLDQFYGMIEEGLKEAEE
ncbi:MAG: OmpA family protein [Flavobacteriales bacterium]|nr:OmpA family protein [Flavobacteriales bacterium]